MNKLTAEQARELAGPTVEERVDKILVRIEELAKAKQRSLKTGWDYKEDKKLWIDEGYGQTENWRKAKKILTDLGYTVSFHYDDSCYFVDMYTVIKW